MAPPRHAALLLAAGRGSRLGGIDKAGLRRPDGRSFLDHAVAAALASAPLELLVVRRPEQPWPLAAALQARVRRIDCADAAEGMAASLRSGLRALPPAADGVLVLLLDQPALDGAHLEALCTAWRRQPGQAAASSYAGVRGAPALLPRAWFGQLLQLHGDVGARDWLRRDGAGVLEVAAPGLALDVDRAGDGRDWR